MLSYTTVIRTSQPVCQIHYMDYKYEDAVSKNEFLQLRRGLKVESLVNDAEYDESKLPEYIEMPSMGLSMYSKSVTLNTYRGVTKWQTWISELERVSLTEVTTGGWNLDVSLSAVQNDFLNQPTDHQTYSSYAEYLQRKLISKTISGTSYIASVGRRGPGNVAFVGSNVIQHFTNGGHVTFANDINNSRLIGSVGGVDIVFCPEISPDRVIVFRGRVSNTDTTLMLVEADFDDNRWAIVSTGKAYCISYNVTA